MYLLARVRPTIEEGRRLHLLAIERESPNGQIEPAGPDFRMMDVPPTAETGPDGTIGFCLNYCLANLVFPEAGVYKYRLRIDGQEIGVAKLLVTGPTPREHSP